MPESVMLVKVEAGANANKFYRLDLADDGTVKANWGRVGARGQFKDYPGGRAKFDSLLRAKKAKGYREVEVVGEGTRAASNSALRRASLSGLAKPEFRDDARITTLVDSMVAVNAHSIASTSGGKITLDDGVLRTPLGVIGRASLNEAEALLATIAATSDHATKVRHLEHYLTLVPQKVGSQRGWEATLLTPEALGRQSDFVNQLKDSLDFIETQNAATDPTVEFRYRLGIVEQDDPRFIIDEWRHDVGSVMVGTRSLMTGVDAKGETCTLVVIDRVPRAMGNVVDDARVKAIAEQLDLDKWSADKFVYVSDAALLLEQAFGRLIRTMDDSGLAVCLDPRIVPGSPLSYRRDVTDIYLKAMRRFSNRRSSLTSALDYIKDKQA